MTTAELTSLAINSSLALITGLYAYFTYKILGANLRMAEEMALQRLAMIRPIISIVPQVDEYLVVSLLIRNSGSSPALNVDLTMNDDFYRFSEFSEGNNIRTLSAFQNTISAFSVGSELRFDLAQGFNLGKSEDGKVLTPLQFTISAKYDFGREKFSETSHIDLRPFMNSTVRRSKSVDEAEKIRKAIESIATKLS